MLGFQLKAETRKLVGTKAPEITFSQTLNYETEEFNLSDLKGKVVILDFWATWCAPCVASFPQLEELQAIFQDQLQIVTISSETEERLLTFLHKTQTSLPIAIDRDLTIAKIFPHRTIPHTVVIDEKGVIRAVTTSSKIDEALIRKVINDEPLRLEEKIDITDAKFDKDIPLSGNTNLTFQATFQPYVDGLSSMVYRPVGDSPYSGRRILAVNFSARGLYEVAHQFPSTIRTKVALKDPGRIKWNKQNAVCFDLIVPEDKKDHLYAIMLQQLNAYFDFKVDLEPQSKKVKVLKVVDGQTANLISAEPGDKHSLSYGGDGFDMTAGEISKLTEFLENQFHIPVVDDTGLAGKYNLKLPWQHEDPLKIHVELKKLGLELIEDTRVIDMLVIRD